MFFKKDKNKNVLHDMQADNIYKTSMLEKTDWQSSKNFDLLWLTLLENVGGGQPITLNQLFSKMIEKGLDKEKAIGNVKQRFTLREGIIGDNDVEAIKSEFIAKKAKFKSLEYDIEYYERKAKDVGERPFTEDVYKSMKKEYTSLKDWLHSNKWVANHEMK